jgi:hypothetical protein
MKASQIMQHRFAWELVRFKKRHPGAGDDCLQVLPPVIAELLDEIVPDARHGLPHVDEAALSDDHSKIETWCDSPPWLLEVAEHAVRVGPQDWVYGQNASFMLFRMPDAPKAILIATDGESGVLLAYLVE